MCKKRKDLRVPKNTPMVIVREPIGFCLSVQEQCDRYARMKFWEQVLAGLRRVCYGTGN